MMTHDDAFDLLAAFALDAVDDAERREIELHVRQCPRCLSELVGLREVASALGNCVEPVPEDLWSGISGRLVIPREDNPPSLPRAIFTRPLGEKGITTPRSRAGRRYLMAVTAVAAAAVAAAGILGINMAGTNEQNNRLQAQIGSNASSVVAALEAPGHKLVDLKNAERVQLAQFVVLPSGRGYMVSSSLPKLDTDKTYQLWATVGGQAISIGLLGPAPSKATFTLADANAASQLGVTVEPYGGSVVPTSTMLASGTF